MAWSVDRLGRSLQDLVGFLSEIHASGVDLFLHQQGIDTTTPGGKASSPNDSEQRHRDVRFSHRSQRKVTLKVILKNA
jgi:hypothetical protein